MDGPHDAQERYHERPRASSINEFVSMDVPQEYFHFCTVEYDEQKLVAPQGPGITNNRKVICERALGGKP